MFAQRALELLNLYVEEHDNWNTFQHSPPEYVCHFHITDYLWDSHIRSSMLCPEIPYAAIPLLRSIAFSFFYISMFMIVMLHNITKIGPVLAMEISCLCPQ